MLFKDVTQEAELQSKGVRGSFSSGWIDFNNDGLQDIWVAPHQMGVGGRNENYVLLYINDGDGTFTDIGSQVFGPTPFHYEDTNGSGWADFDNDGDQDFFIVSGARGGGRGSQNWFFVNEDGFLEERSNELGLDLPQGRGRSVLWFDWDNDGLLDVIQLNSSRPNDPTTTTLFNQTVDGFVDVNNLANLPSLNSMSAQVADLYGDGQWDLIVIPETVSQKSSDLKIYDYSSSIMNDLTNRLPEISDIDKIQDAIVGDFDGDLVADIILSV